MNKAQFEQYKDHALAALDIIAVARWLGLEVKGDRAPCPFHSERSIGAFQFKTKKCYCHCYSCGASADAIGLTAYMKGIRPAKALRELNTVFRLGLNLDSGDDKIANEEYEKKQAQKHYNKAAKGALKNILQELKSWAQTLYPRDRDGELDKRYIFALQEKESVEAYLTAFSDDNVLNDAHTQVKAWLQTMRKLDPSLEPRQRIKAEISDAFAEFIEGRIDLGALRKKHKILVKKFQDNLR